jgi:hypothetical protein
MNYYDTTVRYVAMNKLRNVNAFRAMMRNGKILVNGIKMIDTEEPLYSGDVLQIDKDTLVIK